MLSEEDKAALHVHVHMISHMKQVILHTRSFRKTLAPAPVSSLVISRWPSLAA